VLRRTGDDTRALDVLDRASELALRTHPARVSVDLDG
jgi:Cdc6-like AAA superfamily ATPase